MSEGDSKASDPLVRLGRGGNPSPPEGVEERERKDGVSGDDRELPRWAATSWLVGSLAVAQAMLLTAVSAAESGVVSLFASAGELALAPALAAALGTWFAALAARECGAGRMGQLVLALALLLSPRVAGLAVLAESSLPLVAPLALWSQLRALRTARPGPAVLCAACALALGLGSPSGWLLALTIGAGLAGAGPRSFLSALATALAGYGLLVASGVAPPSLEVGLTSFGWPWTSPLALGLPLIALAGLAVLRLRSLSRWLRPFLASMLAATALAASIDPEVAYVPLLGLAGLGAGWIGAQAEVRGQRAMAGLVVAVCGIGLALLPLFALPS